MHLVNAVTDGHDDCADGSAFVHQLQTSRKTRGMKGNDSFHGLDCLSPRLMLSKLLRRRRKLRELAKVEDVKGETMKEELQGSKLELARDQSKHQIRCLPEDSSNKDLDSIGVAGQYGKDTCFNMAVGLGLLHLLSISKNELNKMVELRTQMELLFQNVKDESSQKKNIILTKQSETTNCIVDSENSVSYNRSVVLEAELKAEMELMQLHLNNDDDDETSSEYQKQQSMEMTFGDASDHHQEESIVSVNFGGGGIVDHSEEVSFAVCPMELERRLYGLLEIRQKERIHHLEAALESAKLKISEREKEIYRWKYAARYVSRRIPDSQSLSR